MPVTVAQHACRDARRQHAHVAARRRGGVPSPSGGGDGARRRRRAGVGHGIQTSSWERRLTAAVASGGARRRRRSAPCCAPTPSVGSPQARTGSVTVTASLPGDGADRGRRPGPVPWRPTDGRCAAGAAPVDGRDRGTEALHEELARAGHPDLRPAHGYALTPSSTAADTASALGPMLGMSEQGAAKLLQTLVEGGCVEVGAASRRRPAEAAHAHRPWPGRRRVVGRDPARDRAAVGRNRRCPPDGRGADGAPARPSAPSPAERHGPPGLVRSAAPEVEPVAARPEAGRLDDVDGEVEVLADRGRAGGRRCRS